jgi:hypothetical protein
VFEVSDLISDEDVPGETRKSNLSPRDPHCVLENPKRGGLRAAQVPDQDQRRPAGKPAHALLREADDNIEAAQQ